MTTLLQQKGDRLILDKGDHFVCYREKKDVLKAVGVLEDELDAIRWLVGRTVRFAA